MATTFNVISLGIQTEIDTVEGNSTAENSSALVGMTFGDSNAPLHQQVKTFSQYSSWKSNYLIDGTQRVDQFTIDGGSPQTFDGLTVYNATLTYADGTTEDITAVVAQSTTGETYLVPEMSQNSDQDALEAKPIASLTLNSVNKDSNTNLGADRMDWDVMSTDGVFQGTGGDDNIDLGDVDDDGDMVTTGDDSIVAGMGDDTVSGSTGDDTIDGGTGDDQLSGDEGDDSIDGGRGDDVIRGGDGNDTIDAGAGHDTVYAGEGDDLIRGDSASETIGTGTIQTEWTALHLGTGLDMDSLSDGAKVALGSYGDLNNPLGSNQVRVKVDDADGDGVADNNNYGSPETVDINGTPYHIDAVAVFECEITFEDGSTDTISAVVFQTEDGNMFLAPEMSYNADAAILESGPIQSINLISVINDSTNLSADRMDLTFADGAEHGNDFIDAGSGQDTVIGGGGDDTIYGRSGNDHLTGGGGGDQISGDGGSDTLDGGDGDDLLWGGDGNDVFIVSDGNDTIADFNAGNTGAIGDGDSTNNDFVDLSKHYDSLSEMHADLADDGVLNQSNSQDLRGNAVDYSDNAQFGSGSLSFKGDVKLTADNTGVVCFTPGTAILTPSGERAVEDLRAGDYVTTLDNGPQQIVWIGSTTLSAAELAANPKLMPVLVSAQTLGTERSLLVSPQHGLILPGTDDTLVRAKHLRRFLPGSRVARGKRSVTYVHMIFESHQIVFSNGYPTESLYPGPQAMKAMSAEARAEVEMLFPCVLACETKLRTCSVYGATARQFRAA